MHQKLRLPVLKAALLALLTCPFLQVAFAQDGLAPRDEQVVLSDACVLAPSSIIAGGQAISVWHRQYPAGGIYARSGQRFDSLGLATQLFAEEYTGDPKVAPIAGGFVVAWNTTDGLRFQRFAAELTPLDAAVFFDPNGGDLAIDEDGAGGFILAWVNSSSGLKTRRFSAAGTPLTTATNTSYGQVVAKFSCSAARRAATFSKTPGGGVPVPGRCWLAHSASARSTGRRSAPIRVNRYSCRKGVVW